MYIIAISSPQHILWCAVEMKYQIYAYRQTANQSGFYYKLKPKTFSEETNRKG